MAPPTRRKPKSSAKIRPMISIASLTRAGPFFAVMLGHHVSYSPGLAIIQARWFPSSQKRSERGGEVLAARRAGYPWPEQMARKMLRNVEKRGVQTDKT